MLCCPWPREVTEFIWTCAGGSARLFVSHLVLWHTALFTSLSRLYIGYKLTSNDLALSSHFFSAINKKFKGSYFSKKWLLYLGFRDAVIEEDSLPCIPVSRIFLYQSLMLWGIFWPHRWAVQHREVIERKWVSSLNCRHILSTFSTGWLECQDIAISRMDFPYQKKKRPTILPHILKWPFPPIASLAVGWDEDAATEPRSTFGSTLTSRLTLYGSSPYADHSCSLRKYRLN